MCERKRDTQKHVTRILLKILLPETFVPTHRVKLVETLRENTGSASK